MVLFGVIWRNLQRSAAGCVIAWRRQQRHARVLGSVLGNGCMEPSDRCKHGAARSVGAQDDPHTPHTRRSAGSVYRGRWGSATGVLSPLGWNGCGVDRRRFGYLRWLRHLVPVLPGVEESEDNVWPEFVGFTTVLRELDAGLESDLHQFPQSRAVSTGRCNTI